MDEKQKRLRLIELELELRKRRSSHPAVGAATQGAGSTIVAKEAEPPPPTDFNAKRELAIQGSGLAAGATGGLADIAMLPSRALGGVVAGGGKLAEMAGAGPAATAAKESGLRVLTAPSEVSRAQSLINRTIGTPSNLTAGEKARQAGAQATGQLLGGGAVRGVLQAGGKMLATQAPRVSQALQGAASSRATKIIAPSRPADLAAAYGAGSGAEYLQQYAGDNPLMQTGAAVLGGVGTGIAAGMGARGIGSLAQGAKARVMPRTGVGTSLVGEVGKTAVNPEQKFGSLAGTVRRSAVNAETSLDAKYRTARELSAGSQITPQGVKDIRSRISALALGTADPDHKRLHENILSNLDQMIRDRGGMLKIDDVAENIRKQYSNAGPKMAFAKGEGVRTVDGFLSSALDNPNLVNNVGKKASKAWKEAIGFAREKYAKYDDPSDIAKIIQEETSTQRAITPAQVGEMFTPSAKGSNLTNKWDAVMSAIPAGEKKYINQTIKSGIMHDILKRSSDATPAGYQINEGNLAGNLDQLIKDPVFTKKFNSTEQAAIRKLQASLTGARLTARKLPQLLGAAVYAISGQGYGATRLAGESTIGPPTANLDEIIQMLEKPVAIKRTGANFTGSVVLPTVTNQLLPQQTPPDEPKQQPVIGPQSFIQQPSRRLNYAEAKKQKGIA